MDRSALLALYERYLALCNARDYDALRELVSDEVSGSGSADGRDAYIERVRDICVGFSDYRWKLLAVVVEDDTIAARLVGRGTHDGRFGHLAPTGRRVEVQELVVYRWADGQVVACWGDLYPVLRDALTAPAGVTG